MKKKILIAIVIVALLVIAGGIYYWTTNKTGDKISSAQVEAILSKLGARMILPTGEVPQIAPIDDPIESAKIQPFVSGAVKGDLLIVYVKAAKAIVYSPSRDLIVNVGPVTMNPGTPSAPAQGEPATSTAKAPTKK